MEGARVYVKDSKDEWQKATCLAALGGGKYTVQLEAWEGPAGDGAGDAPGATLEVDASQMEGGTLPFQNAGMPTTGFPDMTTLDHLHEAALVHNLRVRFFGSTCPYTYTADIVIAVNPYRWFPELYTDEMRKEYLVFDRSKLMPHVYATSSQAFCGLQETNMDQTILVSGESGAGKTETVKILMAHLALIASSDDPSHIKRIVESNPLLESFGNAQTVRNDNSSRFGKFVELELNASCRLAGSRCRTYLLEKSRVVGQDAGERNYHIFYQMLAVDEGTRSKFFLGGDSYHRDTMRYTRTGGSKTDTIEGKHDSEKFHETVAALALVGVEGAALESLLRALAGVLLLGQLEFGSAKGEADGDEAAVLKEEAKPAAAQVAATLQVDVAALDAAVTKRTIKTRNESFIKPLTTAEANATVDALAKELYARVFDWLVSKICAATSAPGDAKHFVGLLDIFGFESFAINRFEQLCINYANEKLQQKFTLDVFKAVQQEYTAEGIPWEKIEFKDNAPVLALIESKLGVIAMLNEEGVRPKGSDQNFVSKLLSVHKDDPAFSTPRVGKQKDVQFTIAHYAGSVTYTTVGWLERNKDTVSDDVMTLLRSSSDSLLPSIFAEAPKSADEGEKKGAKAGSETVATKFRVSLTQLMETISKTTSQYVRCIKPNKQKSPLEVDNPMVLEQLRCAGVIEAIQVSRAGFPARMPVKEFVPRFTILARSAAGALFARGNSSASAGATAPGTAEKAKAALAAIKSGADKGEICRKLMLALAPAGYEGKYEIGRTRMYFKGGLLESFEERRALLLQAAATELEAHVRGFLARRRYRKLRRMVLVVQARRRMCCQRRTYLKVRRCVVLLQSRRRGLLARRWVIRWRRERSATKLQAWQRRCSAMRRLTLARRAAMRLQAIARQRACRRQYLTNLAEFREQAKLENQVKALQAKLEAQEQAARNAAACRDQQPTAGTAGPSAAPPPAGSEQPSEEILGALQALAAENAKLRIDLERYRNENEELRRENYQLRSSQSTRSARLAYLTRSRVDDTPPPSAQKPADAGGGQTNGWNDTATPPDPGSPERPVVDETDPVLSNGKGGKSLFQSSPSHQAPAPEHRMYAPLSHFWQDVPFAGLPLLKSGSEVHIKFGANIMMVDSAGKRLVWQSWMQKSPGYLRSMAFVVERRLEQRSGSRGGRSILMSEEEKSFGPGDEGCLGLAFALRSAYTNKYVVLGGLMDWYRMQVTAEKPEDAAVFTFVPMPDSNSNFAISDEPTSVAENCFALRLLSEKKMLHLRPDGCVGVVAVSDADGDIHVETMAAAIEYLRPCMSYDIIVHEKQIGIAVTKDLPLRVAGFTSNTQPGAAPEPGPAELSGRVRVGDIITAVNGQDIEDVPRTEVLKLIAQARPVTLGFKVMVPGSESEGPL